MSEWTTEQCMIEIDSLRHKMAGSAGTARVANNLTTTASGYVLDARQGRVLNEKINKMTLPLSTTAQLYRGAALITGSGKQLRFTVSSIKALNLDTVTSVTVTPTSLVIYYNGANYEIDLSSITVSAQWYNWGVVVEIAGSDALVTGANNVPVGMSMRYDITVA